MTQTEPLYYFSEGYAYLTINGTDGESSDPTKYPTSLIIFTHESLSFWRDAQMTSIISGLVSVFDAKLTVTRMDVDAVGLGVEENNTIPFWASSSLLGFEGREAPPVAYQNSEMALEITIPNSILILLLISR